MYLFMRHIQSFFAPMSRSQTAKDGSLRGINVFFYCGKLRGLLHSNCPRFRETAWVPGTFCVPLYPTYSKVFTPISRLPWTAVCVGAMPFLLYCRKLRGLLRNNCPRYRRRFQSPCTLPCPLRKRFIAFQ
jgi:hypothetical protein